MIISIANQKGGVGKTVTAINLSAALAREGFRTLLIDMDPQGHSTVSLYDGVGEIDGDLFSVFRGELPPSKAILRIEGENMDILPATLSLAKIERDLIAEVDGHFALKDIADPLREKYDFIIVDAPPALGMLTVNCLVAADYVLIPIQASYLSLEGTDDLLDTIERVKNRLNPRLEIVGALITIHDRRTILGKDVVSRIEQVFGDKVFSTTIGKSVRLEESPAYRESIFRYAPSSPSAAEYGAICKEVIERVNAQRPAG